MLNRAKVKLAFPRAAAETHNTLSYIISCIFMAVTYHSCLTQTPSGKEANPVHWLTAIQ